MRPDTETLEAEITTINEYATELQALGPGLLDYVDIGLKLLAIVLLLVIATRL